MKTRRGVGQLSYYYLCDFMETRETHPPAIVRAAITPKAFLYQKYGPKAVYKIEEIKDPSGNGCPGMVITQQSRNLYRCCLELPELSVTSEAFTKKKEAEQYAAKLAIEKVFVAAARNCRLPVPDSNEELHELCNKESTRRVRSFRERTSSDRVFGPATTTRHVYDDAAQQVVSGAMQGINGI